MKNYPITDVRGDATINPAPAERRPVGNITSIIIHHDAVTRPHNYDTMARLRQEAAGHTRTLGPGLQYHYSIDNVGEIFWCRPHEATLWNAGNLAVNRTSIAVKLDGYFHSPVNQQPTREQLEALNQLLDKLCTQHPEFPASTGDVYGHRQIVATACPGDLLFPYVDEYRRTGNISIPGHIGYDWPSFQPAAPVVPSAPPAPVPTPPSQPVPVPVPTPPPVITSPEVKNLEKDVESIKLGQVEQTSLLKQILAGVQAILTMITRIFK